MQWHQSSPVAVAQLPADMIQVPTGPELSRKLVHVLHLPLLLLMHPRSGVLLEALLSHLLHGVQGTEPWLLEPDPWQPAQLLNPLCWPQMVMRQPATQLLVTHVHQLPEHTA
eukprot:GHUV01009850.1.p2 GENE.GHUV01009850.1~~GHUV01009850.1.p2  ORF type:complete len:112 (-),score=17.66 GHUV01009850.1:1963-2298(-)